MRPSADDIEELLESGSKQALAKDANTTEATTSSRRGSRSHVGDNYSSEREHNDELRAKRSMTGAMPDVASRGASPAGSANGSVRSRRRSRSPDRRSHYSPRGYRGRGDRGDYYNGNGRSRRDDYSPRRSGDDDRPRTRDRDRDRRDNGRRGDRDGDRYRSGGGRDSSRHRRPSPRRAKTPEVTDEERDRRTVFVQQLAARLRTSELKSFFEAAGPVVEAQIVKDRVSGRSKGVGYVEFKDEESVLKAIQLTGQKLCGLPIIAQLTEAEKNRQARTTETTTATQTNGTPFHRLYVGNIHFSITEDDLKNVFEPFGELEFVQLQKEEQGRSKGYGFVQFIDAAQAKEALEKMNGFELAGRPIRVGLGNDKHMNDSTVQRYNSANSGQAQGSAFSGMGGRGAHAGGRENFDRASGKKDAEKTGGASALDDSDVSGVNFSNFSRDALMRKLARTEEPKTADAAAPRVQTRKPQVEQPTATRCVLLKNMFTATDETEPNWKQELEEDVRLECEDKYGKVVHISVSLENDDGEIYVKFDRVQGGENAIRGLNGRWFGGRMITAQYVSEVMYNSNFSKAAGV